MPILYERYITGGDNSVNFWTTTWEAQTFTPSVSHKISKVRILCYRSGAPGQPGTITVSIRATDVATHPTGADLTRGTFDGNAITTSTDGEYAECVFATTRQLVAGTKYAIVVRALDGDVNNQFIWKSDTTSATYSKGDGEESTDSGVTWTTVAVDDDDYLFEEYGDSGSDVQTGKIWGVGSNLHLIDENGVERVFIPGASADGATEGGIVTYYDTVVVHEGNVVYV